MQEDSLKDIRRFSGLDQERNGTDSGRTSRMENGMMSLNTCCSILAKADIPYSVEPVLRNEELWKAKEGGTLSFHFCGDDETAEVVRRAIISVNQLSIYGVADICDELAWRISVCSESTGKLAAQNNSENMVMPTIVDNEQNASDH